MGQDQVSGGVNVLCWLAAPVAMFYGISNLRHLVIRSKSVIRSSSVTNFYFTVVSCKLEKLHLLVPLCILTCLLHLDEVTESIEYCSNTRLPYRHRRNSSNCSIKFQMMIYIKSCFTATLMISLQQFNCMIYIVQ